MKAPLKYKEFAKPAVCFGLVIGMLLPLVSCRKAEEKVTRGSSLPCRYGRVRLRLSSRDGAIS